MHPLGVRRNDDERERSHKENALQRLPLLLLREIKGALYKSSPYLFRLVFLYVLHCCHFLDNSHKNHNVKL